VPAASYNETCSSWWKLHINDFPHYPLIFFILLLLSLWIQRLSWAPCCTPTICILPSGWQTVSCNKYKNATLLLPFTNSSASRFRHMTQYRAPIRYYDSSCILVPGYAVIDIYSDVLYYYGWVSGHCLKLHSQYTYTICNYISTLYSSFFIVAVISKTTICYTKNKYFASTHIKWYVRLLLFKLLCLLLC